jgi:hypothetical protein
MLPRLAIVTVTALVLLTGCTSSGDSDDDKGDKGSAKPSATTTTTELPAGPDCAGIWKDGATLPKDYTRCVEGGAYGAQDVTACEDGTQLVAYADTYFAITGGRISKPKVAPMQDTEEFGKVYTGCTGE